MADWATITSTSSFLGKEAFKALNLVTIDPQFIEDSLGLVGRSEPTEFGRWFQWTSVLMAAFESVIHPVTHAF
eukprot:scaffold957_cov322-Pavlova_lutheri.AAC.3